MLKVRAKHAHTHIYLCAYVAQLCGQHASQLRSSKQQLINYITRRANSIPAIIIGNCLFSKLLLLFSRHFFVFIRFCCCCLCAHNDLWHTGRSSDACTQSETNPTQFFAFFVNEKQKLCTFSFILFEIVKRQCSHMRTLHIRGCVCLFPSKSITVMYYSVANFLLISHFSTSNIYTHT